MHTPLLKFGMPPLALWLVVRVVVSWVRYDRSHAQMPPLAFAVATGCLVLFPLLAWSYARLKRVAMADGALHVSNFRREIIVPLRDVDRVWQPLLSRDLIIIHLARDTEFGDRIVFQPRDMYFARFLWAHPMVDRLRDAVAAAKQKPAG